MLMMTRKVYLDHNATTPLDGAVRDAMVRCLKHTHGNPSSLHTEGRVARGVIEEARRHVAALIRCRPDQLTFTSGGSEGNNTVIKGVFAGAGKGHIISSAIEHESVLGALSQVEQLGGRVTLLQAERDGRIAVDAVARALAANPDTVLISIMHANNETGAVQPIEAIASLAAKAGVPLHSDGVQSVGKLDFDVERLGVSFLTLSAHKIHGPKGVGAIYCRGDASYRPLIFGGGQEREQRAGTEGVHQVVGLGVACAQAARKIDGEWLRLQDLRRWFVSELRQRFPTVQLNEAAEAHQLPGTLNLTFPGHEGIRILAGLDCLEIAVSIGSACTADRIEPSHVLLGMGLDPTAALSSIRVSMGRRTRKADLRYTLKALQRVLQGDPAGFAYIDPEHLDRQRILSEQTFLIDLRLPHERLLDATIPGAREWSHLYFDRYVGRIPRDKEVIMLCGTGQISTAAGYRLAQAGHPSVRVVFGGYQAWRGRYPELLAELRRR